MSFSRSKQLSLQTVLIITTLAFLPLLVKSQNTENGAEIIKKAEAARLTGDFVTSAKLLDDLIASDPRASYPYVSRGMVHLDQKQYSEALVCFEKGKQFTDKKANIDALITIANFNLSRFANAIAAANDAIDGGINNPELLMMRSISFFYLKKYEEAISGFTQIIQVEKYAGVGFVGRGRTFLVLKKHKEAKDDFTAALLINKTDIESLLYRAIANRELQDLDAALLDLDRAIELEPRFGEAFEDRGRIKLQKGMLAEAQKDLEQASKLVPDYAGVLVNLSFIAFRLEDADGLIRISGKAIEKDPMNAMAFNNRAYGQILKGNFKEARLDLDKALQLEPQHTFATNNLALLAFHAGDLKRALALIRTVIDLDPEIPEAYLNRGYIFAAQKKHKEAVADFTKAITLRPWLRLAFVARASSLDQLGETVKATEDRVASQKLLEIIKAEKAKLK